MINDLLAFLDASPVNFMATATAASQLRAAGFQEVDMKSPVPSLEPGKGYFFTMNHSSLYAFRVGSGKARDGFKIIAAHTDSPCFRVKPHPEMAGEGGVVRLNTEVYGGAILYTWFDRPLSLAGRVILRGASPLTPVTRLLHIKQPLLVIPHLAIHFNRQVNEGNPISKQRDMIPILGIVKNELERENLLLNTVASELQVEPEEILDFDLYLYDTTPACLCGLHGEFVSSGRQDDLVMDCAGLHALTGSKPTAMTQVLALFDNEETGSGTKQGAASPFLREVLLAVMRSRGGSATDWPAAVAASFLVSADMAHAFHPNYADKYDPTNHPAMGGGPVIKINAAQKYVTDAESAAIFAEVCRTAGVPCQYFVNHSDVAGGSTLGNIMSSQIPLRGVDMGNPLWAMHSVRETTAAIDYEYAVKAFTQFYNI